MGGNDAEKQYPAPESLCKKKNLPKEQDQSYSGPFILRP